MKTNPFEAARLAARLVAPSAPVDPPTAICVVYDDDNARLRVRSAVLPLLGELRSALKLSFSWWRTKFLYHPQAFRLASDAVARAHVILFAWHKGHTLPLAIVKWLDAALARRKQDEPVLVALLESGPAGSRRPSLAAACLRRSAQKANADFLFNAEPARAGQRNTAYSVIPGREALLGN